MATLHCWNSYYSQELLSFSSFFPLRRKRHSKKSLPNQDLHHHPTVCLLGQAASHHLVPAAIFVPSVTADYFRQSATAVWETQTAKSKTRDATGTLCLIRPIRPLCLMCIAKEAKNFWSWLAGWLLLPPKLHELWDIFHEVNAVINKTATAPASMTRKGKKGDAAWRPERVFTREVKRSRFHVKKELYLSSEVVLYCTLQVWMRNMGHWLATKGTFQKVSHVAIKKIFK